MLSKNIFQKINIRTDVFGLGIKTMDTAYTDKLAIEKMARAIIKKHLDLNVLANYIIEENLLVINEVGV